MENESSDCDNPKIPAWMRIQSRRKRNTQDQEVESGDSAKSKVPPSPPAPIVDDGDYDERKPMDRLQLRNEDLCRFMSQVGHLCRIDPSKYCRMIPGILDTLCNINDDPRSTWYVRSICNYGIASFFIEPFRNEDWSQRLLHVLVRCTSELRDVCDDDVIMENLSRLLDYSFVLKDIDIILGGDYPEDPHYNQLIEFITRFSESEKETDKKIHERQRLEACILYGRVQDLTGGRLDFLDSDDEIRDVIDTFAMSGLYSTTVRRMPHNSCPVYYAIKPYMCSGIQGPLFFFELYLDVKRFVVMILDKSVDDISRVSVSHYSMLMAAIAYILSYKRVPIGSSEDIDLVLNYCVQYICDDDPDVTGYESIPYARRLDILSRTGLLQTSYVFMFYVEYMKVQDMGDEMRRCILRDAYKELIAKHGLPGESSRIWVVTVDKVISAQRAIGSIDRYNSLLTENIRSYRRSNLRIIKGGS